MRRFWGKGEIQTGRQIRNWREISWPSQLIVKMSGSGSARMPMKRKRTGSTTSTDSYRPSQGSKYKKYRPYSYVPHSIKEYKTSDVVTGQNAMTTTGTFTLLHSPVPGTDYTNRIGRKTLIRSVYLKVYVETSASNGVYTTVAGSPFRWILFCDKQPNGAAPAGTDLLNTSHPLSHLNLNNRDRFKILKDKTDKLGPFYADTGISYTYANPQNMVYKYYRKMRQEVIYNGGSAGTIADITSGALYFYVLSEQGGSSHFCNLYARVRFEDA